MTNNDTMSSNRSGSVIMPLITSQQHLLKYSENKLIFQFALATLTINVVSTSGRDKGFNIFLGSVQARDCAISASIVAIFLYLCLQLINYVLELSKLSPL